MFLYFSVADVIANGLGQLDVIGRCCCHVTIRFCNLYLFWLVLLPCCFIMVDGDVVTIRLMF